MKISLTDAGKRFNRDWIFRHFTYEFEPGKSYAITGPNGSGKSTLLQVLGGAIQLNEGNIQYSSFNTQCSSEDMYQYVAICAPYLELVEEMTLQEFFEFHQHFKPFIGSVTTESVISMLGLKEAADKQIRNFSSGMKQRAKLGQAVFSDVPVILLDEPCTNLDEEGYKLYNRLIGEYCTNKLVIVSSNDHHEYEFCSKRILITEWK